MRIVVIGDSLTLPRKVGHDVVKWEETYPYIIEHLLKEDNKKIEVINCGVRERTSKMILGEIEEHIIFKDPDIVIIHVGVVDAAPRIFSTFEKKILSKLPQSIRNYITKYKSSRRYKLKEKDSFSKVEISPDSFEKKLTESINQIYNFNSKIKIIIIPILANIKYMEKKSPGFGRNLTYYNTILAKIADLTKAIFMELSIFESEDGEIGNYFCSDGYHLNANCNNKLAKKIIKELKNY